MLREMAIPVSAGPAAHGEVRRCLLNSENAHLRKAGSELGVLHSMRLQADYDLNDASTEESGALQFCIQKGAAILSVYEACLKEPAKSRVAAGINAYLRKLKP